MIAISEEFQALMFLFLWRVHHSDTLQVYSSGTLIQRKAFRQLVHKLLLLREGNTIRSVLSFSMICWCGDLYVWADETLRRWTVKSLRCSLLWSDVLWTKSHRKQNWSLKIQTIFCLRNVPATMWLINFNKNQSATIFRIMNSKMPNTF